MNRTLTRTLIALAAALLLASPVAVRADEDNGGKHDNGNHNGWYKHSEQGDQDEGNHGNSHKRARAALVGRITAINGNLVTIQRSNGTAVTIDDTPALNGGHATGLAVGQYVRVRGQYTNGVLVASSISQTTATNTNAAGQYGTFYGRVTAINGNMLTVALSDGRTLAVDDSQAAARGQVTNVSVGTWVQISGYWNNGTIVAQSVNGNVNQQQAGNAGITLPGGVFIPIGR